MIKKGWLLILLLALAVSGSGCDKFKGMIKKGKDAFSEKEQSKDSADKNDRKKKRGADRPSQNNRKQPHPADEQIDSTEDDNNMLAFRNEPITYGELRQGQYAVTLKKFRNRYECEDYSRRLRRQRINNYITFDEDSKKYLILTGKFVTRSQAEKQSRYLEKNGYDTEIYSGN